jgi:hypothetical protein
LAFYGPFAFVPAGTQHVIAKVGFIGFALFLRVFHPTVGVQAIDSTDLAVDGSDNCRHTTTLVAGRETSQTHTSSDWDPTDGPTAPSRGNAGRSLIAVKKILTTRGTEHIESATRSRLTFRFSGGVPAYMNVFQLFRVD